MARGRPQLEHLLRRAGFGARLTTSPPFGNLSAAAALDYLLDYERHAPTTSTPRSGRPATSASRRARRVLAQHQHRRRAAALAVPDGALAAAAAGEDGALLAQPLRHRLQQGGRRRRARCRRPRCWRSRAASCRVRRGSSSCSASARSASFRDLLLEVAQDPAMIVWLDGRTNTRQRPQENFGREIMELFTFGIGNYTEQDVYAAARVFTGWNLRLVGDARRPDHGYYEFVLQRQPARDGGQDVHVPDLRRRLADDPGARRRRRACRTASTSSRRWRAIRRPPAAWRASCGTSSSAKLIRRMPDFVDARPPRSTCRPTPTSAPVVRFILQLALVPESGGTGTRAIPGRSSSSPARSRKWAGTASRSTRRAGR